MRGSGEIPGEEAGGDGACVLPVGMVEGGSGETSIVGGPAGPAPPHPGKAVAAKTNRPARNRFNR